MCVVVGKIVRRKVCKMKDFVLAGVADVARRVLYESIPHKQLGRYEFDRDCRDLVPHVTIR